MCLSPFLFLDTTFIVCHTYSLHMLQYLQHASSMLCAMKRHTAMEGVPCLATNLTKQNALRKQQTYSRSKNCQQQDEQAEETKFHAGVSASTKGCHW
jgi:hypothetical protein